jgi:hypothetical protein
MGVRAGAAVKLKMGRHSLVRDAGFEPATSCV